MGLDFDRSDAHWSYGGFDRFRKRLAAAIGINLDDMQGFGGHTQWGVVKDAIKPLLNHSDCDGQLGPKTCAKVAPRLRELVADWPDGWESNAVYDKHHALLLAKGMEECAAAGKPLKFC